MIVRTSSKLNSNNAFTKSAHPHLTNTKQSEVLLNSSLKDLTKTKNKTDSLNFVRFGMNSGNDDIQFSELTQKSKLFAQKKYRQVKAWVKQKTQNQSQDKKDAAVAAGAGVAAGVAAETAIGGLSGGIVGATVAAFTGYKAHKNRQQRSGLPYDNP